MRDFVRDFFYINRLTFKFDYNLGLIESNFEFLVLF